MRDLQRGSKNECGSEKYADAVETTVVNDARGRRRGGK
jgi:hypothetical protein